MKHKVLKVHPEDNVLVALTDLEKGEIISFEGTDYTLQEDIKQKHKFTTEDIEKDGIITMYGVPVGKAEQAIPTGSMINIFNVKHYANDFGSKQKQSNWTPPDTSNFSSKTFNGYYRSNGDVGTANYWLLIPLVFCENRNINAIAEIMSEELGYPKGRDYNINVKSLIEQYEAGASIDDISSQNLLLSPEQQKKNRTFPNIDGIKILTHEGGCGGTRMDAETLCALLAGYVTNPNVAGATILSLGCQNAQPEIIEREITKRDSDFDKPIFLLEQQDSKSEGDLIADAVKQTFTGLMEANKNERKPAPLSKLKVGLECGGSDGFSGISANPAVGHAADLVVAMGGTVILSEFPELCGVEQELSDRCETEELSHKFNDLMTSYNNAALAVGSGFDMNPSPGNIKDGLITDAIKSAGAAKKGGTSPVKDVLDYTEPATKPGLNLLCTPGNDVESTTGLAGSGANIILFTTGLGTPTGNPVAPTIKISSNTALYQKMNDVIDINAGTVISGEDTIETKGEEILDKIIAVASGELTPHAVRLGQNDFIPWKRGVSL